MPANLPPQYHEKEAELRTAKTCEEKIAILQELMAIMPKHKGTEKLQKDLKTRIAKLRRESLQKKATAHGSPVPVIVREGAGQVVIAGPPNSGKSSLLAAMTKARPAIADYPYTTKIPQPGMFVYEDILIQMVDTPALSLELSENWLGDILRKSDMILVLLDISDDEILDKAEECIKVLEKFGIKETDRWNFSKRILWVGNKVDIPASADILPVLLEFLPLKDSLIGISAMTGTNLELLGQKIFSTLNIIRVYTKIPGKPPEMKSPYTLPAGSTLQDLASHIHKDLVRRFRYARLWKQKQANPFVAGREYVLEDRDVVEIHAEE